MIFSTIKQCLVHTCTGNNLFYQLSPVNLQHIALKDEDKDLSGIGHLI